MVTVENPQSQKIVISASRRTDIPAFYMSWFMEAIDQGCFTVVNPFNGQRKKVIATPDQVHTVVFWSKNFGPFLKHNYGQSLIDRGYHLYFNFTINSDDPILEPNVPALQVRLMQLTELCMQFGAESVTWRLDPICYYQNTKGPTVTNLKDFHEIAACAHQLNVKRCITSFMDHYRKIYQRLKARPHFAFVDPPLETKINTLLALNDQLAAMQIQLLTCCEKEIQAALPSDASIYPSACIPNDLLQQFYGGSLILKKDRGQRLSQGCGCQLSVDIGSYRWHPCYHNCLFCYANPAEAVGETIPNR